MRKPFSTLCFLLCLVFSSLASSQQADQAQFNATQLTEKIWLLKGQGGNVAAFVGDDGVLLVDDSFDRLSESLEAAVLELGGGLPRFVLNTHFHADHTGGNAALGRRGHIIAHANTRSRLVEAYDAPPESLPNITYSQEANIYFNDEQVRIIHLPSGHTDGDSIVWFVDSNLVHMGDLLFAERFPFLDLDNGGSFEGALANLKHVHGMLSDSTIIIPGHGPVTDLGGISSAIHMFEMTSAEVRDGLYTGKSVDQLVEEGLSERWNDWHWRFITEERWIRTIAASYSE